jgi:hypothetical protein
MFQKEKQKKTKQKSSIVNKQFFLIFFKGKCLCFAFVIFSLDKMSSLDQILIEVNFEKLLVTREFSLDDYDDQRVWFQE